MAGEGELLLRENYGPERDLLPRLRAGDEVNAKRGRKPSPAPSARPWMGRSLPAPLQVAHPCRPDYPLGTLAQLLRDGLRPESADHKPLDLEDRLMLRGADLALDDVDRQVLPMELHIGDRLTDES